MTVGQLIERLSEMPQDSEVALQIIKTIEKGEIDKIIYVANLNGFDLSSDKHGVEVLWLTGLIEESSNN